MRIGFFFLTGAMGLAAVGGPEAVLAQEGAFAFQIRGGQAIPLGAFKDGLRGWEGETRPGASFGMGFTFPLYRDLGAYLGFSQHRFGCEEGVCPPGRDWASTGFDVAVRAVLGRERVRPWFQGGLHTHRVETRLRESGAVRRTTSVGGAGYEFGGGILVQIAERMSLSPGIRYGEGDAPFESRPDLNLRYWVVDLGLVVGF